MSITFTQMQKCLSYKVERLISTGAVAIVCALAPSASSAWEANEVTNSSGHWFSAIHAIDIPRPGRAPLLGLAIIYFNPSEKCEPHLGIAYLDGNGYGAPVENRQTKTLMNFQINDWRPNQAPLRLVRYSNGFEAITPLSKTARQQIGNGHLLKAWPTEGIPGIEFPLDGVLQAMDTAEKMCRAFPKR